MSRIQALLLSLLVLTSATTLSACTRAPMGQIEVREGPYTEQELEEQREVEEQDAEHRGVLPARELETNRDDAD